MISGIGCEIGCETKRKDVHMKVLALGASLFCALATMMASAAEYYWVPGKTDWTSKESYANADGTAAAKVPSAGDELAIPENCTVTLDCDNAEHFEIANGLARIKPLTSSSFVVLNVPDGEEVTFAPKVNAEESSTSTKNTYSGGIVKRGSGTLILGSGDGNNDYFTCITVEEGILKLPQNAKKWNWRWYDLIAVSNGATLFTCSDAGKEGSALTAPFGLVGEGTVTNDCAKASYLEILGNMRNWSHEFAGKITGNICLLNGRSRFDLSGTENTFYGGIRAKRDSATAYPVDTVMIGLKKIGMKSDKASSAGAWDPNYRIAYQDTREWVNDFGSGYLYIGDGEVTDKDFHVYRSDVEPNFFDAGAVGGITFKGTFRFAYKANQRFVIKGSNTEECVVMGQIKRNLDTSGSVHTNYNWRFIKRGSGAWRFADVADTEMEGVFAVEDGSLRYDSIAEKGVCCSLGYSTQLLEDYGGPVDDSRRVPYAFELGSATDASADPVFEYTGSSKGWCSTRPLAMKGSARLRHSGGGELRLAHLSTLNGAAKTLTLDGDGENAWLYNVCDPHGTLSLIKDGAGTWNIGGTNQISGSVAVKGGTLNLRHHEASHHTWFRLTFKETSGNYMIKVHEIGLYGVDGTRLNGNLAYHSATVIDRASAMSLPEGTIAASTTGSYDQREQMALAVDGNPATAWMTAHRMLNSTTPSNVYWDRPWVTNSPAWYSVAMRLPDHCAAVASYDILAHGGGYYEKTRTPRAFMLEGSADGINWEVLHDYNAGEDSSPAGQHITWRFGGETWASLDACPASAVENHTTGWSIKSKTTIPDLPAVMANVTEISVAAGARLAVTGGDAIELRDGITLTVDASTGAGTLANIILPENGTLNLVNVPEYSGSLEMPISGENVTGLANVAGWNLSIDGVAQSASKRKCRYENGKIVLYNPGTVVVFR